MSKFVEQKKIIQDLKREVEDLRYELKNEYCRQQES